MERDRLKALWQQQDSGAMPDPDEDVGRIAKRLATVRRQVRRRDRIEQVAAIIGILAVGRLVFVLPSFTARAGAAIATAGLVLIIVKLRLASPGRHETDRSVTVREHCENELRQIDAQIALLQSVPFWYVAPVTIGVNVVFAALSPRLAWTIAYLLVTLALGAWLTYINRRAVHRRLIPLRNELKRILGEES